MSGDARLLFFVSAACVAAAALYSFWFSFKSWARNRVIADTPTSRVRSAAQGYVELAGRSLPATNVPNKAPLTGMTCAWWRYKIELRKGREWSDVDSGISEAPFFLDDGTGRCLIDPRGATVTPGATTVWYGPDEWPQGRIPDAPGVLGWLLSRMSTGRYRYTEHRLQPNDAVFAIGEFRSLGGAGDQDPEEAAARLLHEWKRDQPGLLARFDTNRDGKVSAAEWEEARAAAHRESLQRRLAAPPPPCVNTLVDPMDGRAFLLSAVDGASLARRFRLRALAGFCGFVASSAALAWMLTYV
jgi:hypothetical protein